jgi:hypothetical protein
MAVVVVAATQELLDQILMPMTVDLVDLVVCKVELEHLVVEIHHHLHHHKVMMVEHHMIMEVSHQITLVVAAALVLLVNLVVAQVLLIMVVPVVLVLEFWSAELHLIHHMVRQIHQHRLQPEITGLLVVVEDMPVTVSLLVEPVELVAVELVVWAHPTHLQEKLAVTERSQQVVAVVLLVVLVIMVILVELVVLVS